MGLRHPHYSLITRATPGDLAPIRFVEVHSENFFGSGGAALQVLHQVRKNFPVSLHGVGLGLGNLAPLDPHHLRQLRQLVERIDPCLVSEHVCWNATQAGVLHDLLPLPYTQESLEQLCTHISQLQDFLQRQILIENATAYIQFADDEWDEWSFIAEAVKRTGCGVLLDVNNLYVNSINLGTPIEVFWSSLAQFPKGSIGEIHLAGHLNTEDGLVDDHGSPVDDAVWALYKKIVEQFGLAPTLIEWDTQIPEFLVLHQEAQRANQVMHQVLNA